MGPPAHHPPLKGGTEEELIDVTFCCFSSFFPLTFVFVLLLFFFGRVQLLNRGLGYGAAQDMAVLTISCPAGGLVNVFFFSLLFVCSLRFLLVLDGLGL